MTAGRRPPEPFSRDEIVETGERAWGSEIEEATTTGRRVESAGQIAVRPSAEFADRVMAAVAREPLPAPARAAGEAVRHRRLAALVAAVGDGWRVSIGGGRPLAARAQALALVIVAVLVVGSASTLVAVGAANLLRGESGPVETPAPSVVPVTSPSPSPSRPSPSAVAFAFAVAVSPSPSPSTSPDRTPAPTVRPTITPTPTQRPTTRPSRRRRPTTRPSRRGRFARPKR